MDQFLSRSKQAGCILWPYRLCEDAADLYGYENIEVSAALVDALDSIWKIISGEREHPIMQVFTDSQTRGGSEVKNTSNWASTYKLSILPGDRSLTVNFVQELRRRFARIEISPRMSIDSLVFGPGTVLLDLVILCTYLGRLPQDDITIYNVVEKMRSDRGEVRIKQRLTLHEQAVSAYYGLENHLQYLRPTSDMTLNHGGPLAEAITVDGSPYTWPESADPGLTGRETSGMPSVVARPRPRPRPVTAIQKVEKNEQRAEKVQPSGAVAARRSQCLVRSR